MFNEIKSMKLHMVICTYVMKYWYQILSKYNKRIRTYTWRFI